ncbi:perosamine synthetase [Candidatus Methanophagaceae archaeon]|nr:perosamine synthetase [Methanophagales archaeon]
MIPISKPEIGKEEIAAVTRVLESGMLAQGEVVEEFEDKFAVYIGTDYAIATNSGTSALHTALAAQGIKEGDEVITTAFSFFATASCVLMQNATPVFVDIDPKTYNIDPALIEAKISDRTKAIIPVHLYGQPCEMREIMDIAKANNLAVIEDAAQAHGAEYKAKKVGAIGDIGVFSFYSTKNIITGEGGMITTNNEEIAERARLIRNHGQSRRYFHDCLGYNYRMTNIAAAIGLVQLKKIDTLSLRRMSNARYYGEQLKVKKPFVSPNVKHVFHQYTIRVKDRDKFQAHLERNGVGYGIYYPVPLPSQPLFDSNELFEVAELASKDVISIPVNPSLKRMDVEKVVKVVNGYEG